MLRQTLPCPRRAFVLVAVAVAVLGTAATVQAESPSPEYIQQGLEECAFVQRLNEAASAASASSSPSSLSRVFGLLFPSSSPAVNALLATAYISGPPNFLLALCPPNIDPSSLSVMVAFAVGGLLGDTLFHLLPEIFLGEPDGGGVKFVLVEPNRNLLLGVGILSGIVTFMAMDKILRIATGGDGHGHGHGHGHEHSNGSAESSAESSAQASSTALDNASAVRQRKSQADEPAATGTTPSAPTTPANPSVRLAGLLNLIADFTHNITDGLALSSSFYASPALGATTTMAVFFHEIPHEVGDFALLIQSGFSKQRAMGAQFVTAVGAFLGTLIGIAVNELGATATDATGAPAATTTASQGIWGTSLRWGDMLLPFTAGTFLYVGTVAVIPELLETGPASAGKAAEIKRSLLQFAALFVGAAIMLGISWS